MHLLTYLVDLIRSLIQLTLALQQAFSHNRGFNLYLVPYMMNRNGTVHLLNPKTSLAINGQDNDILVIITETKNYLGECLF